VADKPDSKPVSSIEPVLLFGAAAVFAAIVIAGLVSGWVWIPGSTRGSGVGFWASRAESLGDFAMAMARRRQYQAQQRRGHDSLSDRP
jgi:hypothetical protein